MKPFRVPCAGVSATASFAGRGQTVMIFSNRRYRGFNDRSLARDHRPRSAVGAVCEWV